MRGWRAVAIYLLICLVGVPWYWRLCGLDPNGVLGGFPAWTMVALGASLAASLFTALVVLAGGE